MSRFAKLAMVGAAVLTAAPVGAFAQGRPAKASNAQKMQEAASADQRWWRFTVERNGRLIKQMLRY